MLKLLLFVVAHLVFVAKAVSSTPSIVLHVVDASYSGCSTIDAHNLSCNDVVVEGNSALTQFVFVVSSHISDLAGLQFGVEYDSTLVVQSWTQCAVGTSIAEEGWPVSGTGNAIVWTSPAAPSSVDSLVSVGFFTVASGGAGMLSATPDPRIGDAIWSNSLGEEFTIVQTALGVADVNAGGAGYNSCDGGSLGESVTAMFEPNTITFSGSRTIGTLGHATIADAVVDSVLQAYDVALVGKSVPASSESDTLGTARTGEQVRLVSWENLFRLRLPSGGDASALALSLSPLSATAFAFPDQETPVPTTPVYVDDPLFASDPPDTLDRQWNLSITNSPSDPFYSPHIDVDLDAPEAWHYSQGDGVLLVVGDTGFNDANLHEDLVGKVHPSSDTPVFFDSHGSSVASIAAAATNNGRGIAGVAPNTTLFDRLGGSFISGTDTLFDASKSVGADMAVLSVQLFCNPVRRLLWRNLYMLNAVTVHAASNCETPGVGYCPSAFAAEGDTPGPGQAGILVVGGIDPDGTHHSSSCERPELDVAAAGNAVWAAWRKDLQPQFPVDYRPLGGTSMAAPQVAGLAALLISYRPELSADDIEQLIRLSADDAEEPGFDEKTGKGRINAWAAFSLLQSPPYELRHESATGGDASIGSVVIPDVAIYASALTDGTVADVRETRIRKTIALSPNYNPVYVWGTGGAVLSGMNGGSAPVELLPNGPPTGPDLIPADTLTVLMTIPSTAVVSFDQSEIVLETFTHEYWDGSSWVSITPGSPSLSEIDFTYTAIRLADGVTDSTLVAVGHATSPPSFRVLGAQPFTSSVGFAVLLDELTKVRIEIFDLAGRRVKGVHNGPLLRGHYRFNWNLRDQRGRPAAAGVYFARFRSDRLGEVRKLIVVR